MRATLFSSEEVIYWGKYGPPLKTLTMCILDYFLNIEAFYGRVR